MIVIFLLYVLSVILFWIKVKTYPNLNVKKCG